MPITLKDAQLFVRLHHRHLPPPVGHKFSVACTDGQQVRGVVIAGRPVSRVQDDGLTLEVTRCCVMADTPNGCSLLYAAAWRATRALGYRRLITYTLPSEGGSSLRASGFTVVGQSGGGEWTRTSRPRPQVVNPAVKTIWQLIDESAPQGRGRSDEKPDRPARLPQCPQTFPPE